MRVGTIVKARGMTAAAARSAAVAAFVCLAVIGGASAAEMSSIKKVQACLSNAGLDAGTADGIVGAKTRKAIKRFATSIGHSVERDISNAFVASRVAAWVEEELHKNCETISVWKQVSGRDCWIWIGPGFTDAEIKTVSWSGTCERQLASGPGKLTVKKTSGHEMSLEGAREKGVPTEGEIQANYADKGAYSGQSVNGVRSGYGVYRWPDYASYEGEWRDGRPDGEGRMEWSHSNDWMDGNWSKGAFSGPGTAWLTDRCFSVDADAGGSLTLNPVERTKCQSRNPK